MTSSVSRCELASSSNSKPGNNFLGPKIELLQNRIRTRLSVNFLGHWRFPNFEKLGRHTYNLLIRPKLGPENQACFSREVRKRKKEKNWGENKIKVNFLPNAKRGNVEVVQTSLIQKYSTRKTFFQKT